MKSIFLILLPFIIFNIDMNKYSINAFLDYLKKTGYFGIFQEIKKIFGSDYAIDACQEFVQSPHCKIVVSEYMNQQSFKGLPPKSRLDINDLIKLLHQEEILKVLTQFYTIKEIDVKLIKILKKRILLSSKRIVTVIKDNYTII